MAKKTRKTRVLAKGSGQAYLTVTPTGAHKWTVRMKDHILSTGTSSSSVSTISIISDELAPALKYLAKR